MGQNTSNATPDTAGGAGEEPRERNLSIQNHHITADYKIKKKLGQGNFALVRLCQRKSDNKEFAVKIIHKKRLAKPKQQQSIEREVEILQKVDHPHCVRLEAIYSTQNHLYLVTFFFCLSKNNIFFLSLFFFEVLEYCKGGELFDMICQHSHFTENQAVKVVRQVNSALEYLHNLGIVHRDIKVPLSPISFSRNFVNKFKRLTKTSLKKTKSKTQVAYQFYQLCMTNSVQNLHDSTFLKRVKKMTR